MRVLALPALRRSLLLALLPAIAAVRVPNAGIGGVIASDLLARAAAKHDIGAAWRVLEGESFRPEWLVAEGSTGETPLQAAVRECHAELVGLLLTHPLFNCTGIKKFRERREVHKYGYRHSACSLADVDWAAEVMHRVYESQPRQKELEVDPQLATSEAWFLPKQPGEWFQPATVEEVRALAPARPELPAVMLETFLGSKYYHEILRNLTVGRDPNVGVAVETPIVHKLWYLCLRHIQAEGGSEEQKLAERHLRSIGWSLFFRGAKEAMMLHLYAIDLLAAHLCEEDFQEESGMQAEGADPQQALSLLACRKMRVIVKASWDRVGTWLT